MLRAVSMNVAAAAIGHGVNLLRVVLTARLLKPEDFGLFGISMVVYGALVAFSEFNLRLAFIAQHFTTEEEERDWLETGRWLNRIELPARAGTMSVCMPAPGPGTYGIAIRHDVNGNDETDLTQDGGGMSNNPSINIFNLGKPSYTKVAFSLAQEVKAMTIRMRYM